MGNEEHDRARDNLFAAISERFPDLSCMREALPLYQHNYRADICVYYKGRIIIIELENYRAGRGPSNKFWFPTALDSEYGASVKTILIYLKGLKSEDISIGDRAKIEGFNYVFIMPDIDHRDWAPILDTVAILLAGFEEEDN